MNRVISAPYKGERLPLQDGNAGRGLCLASLLVIDPDLNNTVAAEGWTCWAVGGSHAEITYVSNTCYQSLGIKELRLSPPYLRSAFPPPPPLFPVLLQDFLSSNAPWAKDRCSRV